MRSSSLLVSSADIEPDDTAKTVTIRVHRMASPVHDKAIAALLHDLTSLEFRPPKPAPKCSTRRSEVPIGIPSRSGNLKLGGRE